MFIFKRSKKNVSVSDRGQVGPVGPVEISLLNEYIITDNVNSPQANSSCESHVIHMKCCNRHLGIETLYNKNLCPNCNSILEFFIENSPNRNEKEEKDSNRNSNSDSENTNKNNILCNFKNNILYNFKNNDMELLFPVVIVSLSVCMFTVFQGYRALYP